MQSPLKIFLRSIFNHIPHHHCHHATYVVGPLLVQWFSEALPPLVVVRSSWHSAPSAPQFKCSVIQLCSLICVQIFSAPFSVHCWTLLKPIVQYSTVYMQVQCNAVLCSSTQPSLMLWCTFTSALHRWQYSGGVKKGAEGSTKRAIWRSIGGVGGELSLSQDLMNGFCFGHLRCLNWTCSISLFSSSYSQHVLYYNHQLSLSSRAVQSFWKIATKQS